MYKGRRCGRCGQEKFWGETLRRNKCIQEFGTAKISKFKHEISLDSLPFKGIIV
jgi:hypothetical protein